MNSLNTQTQLGAELSAKPRVLLVENDALQALEVTSILNRAGFEVVGPARTVAEALSLLTEQSCDAAVLNICLRGETSEQIAATLLECGKPFVVLSGCLKSDFPTIFSGAPALEKPATARLLIEGIWRCLGVWPRRTEPNGERRA